MLPLRPEIKAHAAISAFRITSIRDAQTHQTILHVRHELRMRPTDCNKIDAPSSPRLPIAEFFPMYERIHTCFCYIRIRLQIAPRRKQGRRVASRTPSFQQIMHGSIPFANVIGTLIPFLIEQNRRFYFSEHSFQRFHIVFHTSPHDFSLRNCFSSSRTSRLRSRILLNGIPVFKLQGSASWLMNEKLPNALPSGSVTPGKITLVDPTMT